MTEKLYSGDPLLMEFDATVERSTPAGDSFETVLDRSCFYPGGGGQPSDRGTLGAARVLDVRAEGEDIVHVTDSSLPRGPVHGVVDGERRIHFMAQHTGEHVLAQALLQAGGGETISVHFGEETTTIELKNPSIEESVLRKAEAIANQVIRENRPILLHDADPSESSRFTLRRAPPDVGRLRIVEVQGYDWVGCCGAHMPSTGGIVLIKVVSVEKIRGHARIHAVMGPRALDDYGRKIAMAQGLSRLLTCGEDTILARVEELLRTSRETTLELRKLKTERAADDAKAAVADAPRAGAAALVVRVFDGAGADYLKAFAEGVVAAPGRVVAAVDRAADSFQWIVASSVDGLDLAPIVSPLLASAEAKGGGRGGRMQGAGKRVDAAAGLVQAMQTALEEKLD